MTHPHPNQPIVMVNGVARFQANPVVDYLSDNNHAWADHRMIAANGWTDADLAQLAQLMGYSVAGWGDLSYVTDAQAAAQQARVEHMLNIPIRRESPDDLTPNDVAHYAAQTLIRIVESGLPVKVGDDLEDGYFTVAEWLWKAITR